MNSRRALVLFSVGLLGLGLVLRAWDLDYPNEFVCDEHHFAENAHRLSLGQADTNDHPSLGKVLIAFAIERLGYTRVALRIVPAIAGMLLVLVSGLLARRLFRSDLAGVVACALVCADGFLVTYSRTAHLDGLVALGVVSAIYVAFRSPSTGSIFAASVVARDSYIYHYLPAYALGQVGLAGFLTHGAERGHRSNSALLGGILMASVLFAPLSMGWPVPNGYVDTLLFTIR